MCGFIGIYGPEGSDVALEIYEGLIAVQHRGQDAAGITTFTDAFHVKKGLGLVRDVFNEAWGKNWGYVPWTETEELRFHVIGGNWLLHEVAVLHVPSRTLVVTDAVECIHPEEHLAGAPPGVITLCTPTLLSPAG